MSRCHVVHAVLAFGIFLFIVCATLAQPQRSNTIYFNYDKGSFTATGNWIPANPKDKPAFVSETEIDCFKQNMSCVEGTAELFMGHPHITLEYLQILKWDNDEILATDSTGICMTVTMQITFAEKRISSTHAMKRLDQETKEACKFFQADQTQVDIFVLKGSEQWNKEHSFFPQEPKK
jgi:hypothetical protein